MGNLRSYTKNIKKAFLNKGSLDKSTLNKTIRQMEQKSIGIIRDNKIKNRELERNVSDLSDALKNSLSIVFNRNTNTIISNLGEVFKNRNKQDIGKNYDRIESERMIAEFFENYKNAIDKQIIMFLEKFKVPNANSVTIDILNQIKGINNSSLGQLQEYQDKVCKGLINYIYTQYEEYEKSNEKREEPVGIDEKKSELSGLNSMVNTDEEIAKRNESNKEEIERDGNEGREEI